MIGITDSFMENSMKRFTGIFLAAMLGFIPATGFSTDKETRGVGMVTVNMETSAGAVVLELDGDKAPETVANFVAYAKDGYYDGTVFHRVIPGFMIQGGGFTPDMQQKPTNAPVKNEADNGLKNDTGTIAMARTNDPNSATAQFFINVKDNTFLNHTAPTPQGWGYTVFGKVVDGMDAVRSIEKVSTGNKGGHQDVPLEAVVITRVTVEEG
jgi:peptidyl-prolyl cis-trans isomerase B (cyclophilin B)